MYFEEKIKNTIRVSNSYDKIRPDSLLGLILVQTVCKGYKRTALAGEELRQDFKYEIKLWKCIKYFSNFFLQRGKEIFTIYAFYTPGIYADFIFPFVCSFVRNWNIKVLVKVFPMVCISVTTDQKAFIFGP